MSEGQYCKLECHPPGRQSNRQIASPRFYALDGLRGIFAVVVAIYHTFWLNSPLQYLLMSNAVVLLDLFFVFSGFLMFTLYGDRLQSRSYPLHKFMVRRVARLYPLHLFMIFAFCAWTLFRTVLHNAGFAEGATPSLFAAGSDVSLGSFFANLLMLNSVGLTDQLTFNHPSWTVGAEFLSYVVFALTIPLTGRLLMTKKGVALAIVFVASLYVYLSRQYADLDISFNDGFLRCLAGFYIGVIAAIIRKKNWMPIERFPTLVEVGTIVVMLVFVILMDGAKTFFVGPYLLLFVLVFSYDAGAISRFLSHKLFLWLAKISYSVYLTHFLIAIGFGIAFRILTQSPTFGFEATLLLGNFMLLVYVMTVCVVSELTFRFIEQPGAAAVNQLYKRFEQKKPLPAIDRLGRVE